MELKRFLNMSRKSAKAELQRQVALFFECGIMIEHFSETNTLLLEFLVCKKILKPFF
ncbi:MAG: hypothetical protein IJ160_00225 [Muribaculaceae bacterium]|nr:hypothetical protein [Muribaculaceae bacterium]